MNLELWKEIQIWNYKHIDEKIQSPEKCDFYRNSDSSTALLGIYPMIKFTEVYKNQHKNIP